MGAYKRVFISLSSVASFLSIGALSVPAFAQDPATPPASQPAVSITATPGASNTTAVTPATPVTKDQTATPDQKDKDKDDKPMKHIAIEANPFGLLIGHYSAQLELMPWRHSAFIINPHFDHVSSDLSSSDGSGNTVSYSESFTGFGTELGYRFYTGKTGMTGFYFGPSVLLGTYQASADGVVTSAGTTSSTISFQQIGGALDIGGQAVVGPGIVIGAGFGLQYTAVNQSFQDLPLTASILAGGGIRPRFLFSIGYAL
jgi:hypothetical protein